MHKKTPLFLLENVFFRTREFAFFCNLSIESATRQLHQLSDQGGIVKVTRGIWTNTKHPHFTPLGCVPYLIDQEQGYVSFLTAMHLRQLISQIPRIIHIATTGHSRKVSSTIGTFEFFHLAPTMLESGIEWSSGHIPYRIASVEKCLLDTLYIATRKGRRFLSLPEIELKDSGFREQKFRTLLNEQIRSTAIKTAILEQFKRIKNIQ